MVASLEVRWFLPGPIPEHAERWFEALGDAVDAEARTDRYLIPTESDDLGLKIREGRIEAKQRTDRHDLTRWGRPSGPPEAWRKWTLGLATDADLTDGWVDVRKTRWQRWRHDGSTAAALELGIVVRGHATWWTVCLEVSGGDITARAAAFSEAARVWLDRPDVPDLPTSAAQGYPAWLRSG